MFCEVKNKKTDQIRQHFSYISSHFDQLIITKTVKLILFKKIKSDMGLIIQKIEPNGKVFKDGRMKDGDRIIEINQTSLIGQDFVRAQEILRDAIKHSTEKTGYLEFRIVRLNLLTNLNFNPAQTQQINIEEDEIRLMDELNLMNGTEERAIEFIEDHQEDNKENEENFQNSSNNNHNDSLNQQPPQATISTSITTSSINLGALNTKKLGKKITIQLVKGAQGLGFKLAARDNCTPGEFSPIYIKSILPKGAAVTDGRLQRGDRLLEVNKIDMTQKTLHEAVNILRNTKLGSTVEIVVSRQMLSNPGTNTSSSMLPREAEDPQNEIETERLEIKNNNKKTKRDLLTLEIPLNDTGSAGLGVSVKGKTKRLEESDCSIDLGIFVKNVINGGAASKDGRLRPNDQLININGFSLLGKSNEEAMLILREAMQYESTPGHIELTVSRKIKLNKNLHDHEDEKDGGENMLELNKRPISASPEKRLNNSSPLKQQIVKVIKHNAAPQENVITSSGSRRQKDDINEPISNSRFNRDAPARRSMSEKRIKLGAVPSHLAHSLTSHSIASKLQQRAKTPNDNSSVLNPINSIPKRSQTANILDNINSFNNQNNSNQYRTIPIEFESRNKDCDVNINNNNNGTNRRSSLESVIKNTSKSHFF